MRDNSDGLRILKGYVVNNNSPKMDGKVQVRIPGMHPPEDTEDEFEQVLNEDLPWLDVNTNFNQQGKGISSLPAIGSWVRIMVPNNLDEMFVIGGFYTNLSFNEIQKGQGETLLETGTFDDIEEPEELDSKTVYPFSHSMKTKSGHFIIIDDTEENERIKIQHKTGQFFEIRPDGNFVLRSNSEETNYTIIEGSLEQYVKDTVLQIFESNLTQKITGDLLQEFKADVTRNITGALKETIQQNKTQTISGELVQEFHENVSRTTTGSLEETVHSDVKQNYFQNAEQTISGNLDITQLGKITLNQTQGIDIKTPAIVTINGQMINLN